MDQKPSSEGDTAVSQPPQGYDQAPPPGYVQPAPVNGQQVQQVMHTQQPGMYSQQPGVATHSQQPGVAMYSQQPGVAMYSQQPGVATYSQQPGGVVTVIQTQPTVMVGIPRQNDCLTCSILNLIFCNLLFGAIAVAFSCMARDAHDRGDIVGGNKNATTAKVLNIVSPILSVLGFIGLVIWLISWIF